MVNNVSNKWIQFLIEPYLFIANFNFFNEHTIPSILSIIQLFVSGDYWIFKFHHIKRSAIIPVSGNFRILQKWKANKSQFITNVLVYVLYHDSEVQAELVSQP